MATVHVRTNTDPHSEHHSGLLHLKVGLLRLKASRIHEALTCSRIARDHYAWRPFRSAKNDGYAVPWIASDCAIASTDCP